MCTSALLLAEFDWMLPLALEVPWSPLLDELMEFDWLIDWATFPLSFILPPWLLMCTVAELLASFDWIL